MNAGYFRSLSIRCQAIASNCFDLRACEELRNLAKEFANKADEAERGPFVIMTRRLRNREGEQP